MSKSDLLHSSVESIKIKDRDGKTIAKIDNDYVDIVKGYTVHIKPKPKDED